MYSVILPMYNETKIIEATLASAREYLDRCFPGNYELLLVDDGSTDDSLAAARRAAWDRLRIIACTPNRGKGYAIRTGMMKANGGLIAFTDVDLAYGLEVLAQGFAVLEADSSVDAVIGSRKLHPEGYASYPPLRKFLSHSFVAVIKIICRFKLSDSQSGIKFFRAESARKIFSNCEINRWSFDFEALLTAQALGMKIAEMPVKIINHRESKMNIVSDSLRMFRDILRIKKNIKKKNLK